MNNQGNGNWCWAASSQAVLKYFNVDKEQKDIVLSVKEKDENGEAPNATGTTTDIKKALKDMTDNKFGFVDFTTKSDSSRTNYNAIKEKIRNDKPVILTGYYTIDEKTSGHSMLCYGYDRSNKDNLKLFVFSSTEEGVDKVTLTCSSGTDTIYNMEVEKNDKTKEYGTFEVTGITYNSKRR